MSSAQGNVGEHLVMAELLHRGFDAYWADRGNPAFDIFLPLEREWARNPSAR